MSSITKEVGKKRKGGARKQRSALGIGTRDVKNRKKNALACKSCYIHGKHAFLMVTRGWNVDFHADSVCLFDMIFGSSAVAPLRVRTFELSHPDAITA